MKKKFNPIKIISLIFFMVFAFSSASFGQQGEYKNGVSVYTNVDKMPEFPGGEEAIPKFIKKNMKYPLEAKKKKIEGKVYIEFVISEKGDVENPQFIRKLEPSLDLEAMRLVKILNGWKPGIEKGKPVKVSSVLAIEFAL